MNVFFRTALLITAIIAPCFAAVAEESKKPTIDCEAVDYKDKNTTFLIDADAPFHHIDHSLTINEIGSIVNSDPYYQGRKVLGLTLTKSSITMNSKFGSVTRKGHDGACLWLETLKVRFIIPDLRVYLPREYPESSCEFREVFEHETDHVEIAQEVHFEYAEKLKTFLLDANKFPTPTNPRYADDLKEAQKELSKEINTLIQSFHEKFATEQQKRQDAIDTESNYNEIQSQCENWQLHS